MAKLAFITARFPFPLNKGDQLRAYHQLRILSAVNEVHLFCFSERKISESDLQELRPFCKEIHCYFVPKWRRFLAMPFHVLRGFPFQIAYFYFPIARKKIQRELHRIQPAIVHAHTVRTAAYVKQAAIRSLDYMDCFSEGAKLELQHASTVGKSLFLKMERRLLQRYEERVARNFNRLEIISEPDRRALPVNQHVEILPNGIDLELYRPATLPKSFDLLFTGNMSYIPNIHAATYSIQKILPELRRNRPHSNILIAGISASHSLKKMASGNIVFRENFGHIREAFAVSRILIAPMQISIGMQNKILQAMAMKIPVVCSAGACAAIGATPEIHLLVGDSPESYAAQIHRILENEKDFDEMRDAAYHFVHENYDWRQQVLKMNAFLEHAATQ